MFSRFVLIGALLAVGLSTAACAGMAGFSNEKIRYKMTVKVQTPEGIRTGFAIREAGRYTEPSILPDQGGTMYNLTRGEAVVIDLGQRGVLFALLGGEDEARDIFKYLSDAQKLVVVDLLSNNTPLRFFYFKDLSDPMTVEPARDVIRCSPDVEGCSNGMMELSLLTMDGAFGPGVTIKRVDVARTDEPFEDILHVWLPWLPRVGGKYLHEKSSARGAPYALHGGNFKVGD